jgi:hypothetical protein
MVVEPVLFELVSGAISLFYRENTGNFCKIELFWALLET